MPMGLGFAARHVFGFNTALLCSRCKEHHFTHNATRNYVACTII